MTDAARSTARPAEAALPARRWDRAWDATRRVDPRYLIAGLITLVLLAAQLRYHLVGGYERLAIALGACMAVEAALSWLERGKVVNLQSAYISGISLTLLEKPQGGALWPVAVGAVLAISSKYVLRYRDGHLWNPTNFAIVTLLLAAPNRVSVLSHQWGNDLATNLVIWAFGLLIASRVRVLHITLTYVASFVVLAALRALLFGQPVAPELAPVTGPMYQLFVFFMITDPRTVVKGRGRQMAVAVAIAVAEALIRLASDAGWPLPVAFNAAPPLVALFLVGPVAKWLDLRRTAHVSPAKAGLQT